MRKHLVLALYCIILLHPLQSPAQQIESGNNPPTPEPATFTPNLSPVLRLSHTGSEISVDGLLDESAWATAARATNFAEVFPGDQTRPSIDVTGLMTYDEEYLYVGFIVRDTPSRIRANLSDRDAIWQDDYAGILLDPNRDGQALYFIAANPLGVQADTRISSNDEDDGFDLLFYSDGRITEDGYEIELAIPFKSLRFPNRDVQFWGATFWITHPRDSRSQYSWAAISRDNPCWSCQLGTIEGIRGIRSGRNLEFLPAVTSAGTGALRDSAVPESGFNNSRVTVEPSLNVKYGITSELTADITVNPDFSQIESDQAQIDVNSTFALFFPERRPFFQEGAGLFNTEIQTVYTRSINDPVSAGKLTGRFGATDIAYIGARDNTSPLLVPFEEESRLLQSGRSFSNILRIKHNFGNDSFLGGLMTDRRLDSGGAGSTVGIDGAFRFWKKYSLSGQIVVSRSQEAVDHELSKELEDITFGSRQFTGTLDGESFWGHAMQVELNREARYWSFEAGYEGLSPTFRADNGFVRQNNNQRLYVWQGVTLYPSKHLNFVDRIRPNVVAGSRWNYEGLHKSAFLSPGLNLQFKRQTNIEFRYVLNSEHFAGELFSGLREWNAEIYSNFSEPVQLGFGIETGDDIARFLDRPEVGRSLELEVFASLRPGQHLSVQPLFAYSRLKDKATGEDYFRGFITRARFKYQFSRRFFMRTVVQYNDFNKSLEVDPLITYKINAFSALHAGSTHDFDQYTRQSDLSRYFRQRSRQVFFKFQYLFRV